MFYDSSQDQSTIHYLIAALLIFVALSFLNFTSAIFNDHYFIIIYRPFKKFGTCNHNLCRYKFAQILESDSSFEKRYSPS